MEQTKEVLKFVIELGEALDKSLEDKKFELSDLTYFINPMMSAEAAFAGISDVKEELKTLDQAKKKELAEWIKQEFDISNDELENKIEASIQLAVDIFGFVSIIRGK